MNPIDMLKSARASRYGSAQNDGPSESGSVNRSFPLTEDELKGLGEGPMSLRVDGEGRGGKFEIKSIVKFEDNNEEDTRAMEGPRSFDS